MKYDEDQCQHCGVWIVSPTKGWIGDDDRRYCSQACHDDETNEPTASYTQLLHLHGVSHIAELLRRMSPEAYHRSDGSYAEMPTWGPKTDRVEEYIRTGGDYGDIVSWDTRPDSLADHRYLVRLRAGDAVTFVLVVERNLGVLD